MKVSYSKINGLLVSRKHQLGRIRSITITIDSNGYRAKIFGEGGVKTIRGKQIKFEGITFSAKSRSINGVGSEYVSMACGSYINKYDYTKSR